MTQLRAMKRQRERAQVRVADAVSRANYANSELRRQYRALPILPLALAAAVGFALGNDDKRRGRLPPGVRALAWRGLASVARGWM